MKLVDYLREYYELGVDVSDKQIIEDLSNSLGAGCFAIEQFKKALYQAVLDVFPIIRKD